MQDRLTMLKEMRQQGLTYQQIGSVFGVTRQRIYQLLSGYNPRSSNPPTKTKPSVDPHIARRRADLTYRQRMKLKLFSHYSNGKCACVKCGFGDIRALSIDHINGGGTKHREKLGYNIYHWLIKNNYPEGFQVLCYNCQAIKRLENHEVRH